MNQRDQAILDEVTRIRMQNNVLWMKIVEIALVSAEDTTKIVLRQINSNDRNISDLLKDLAQ